MPACIKITGRANFTSSPDFKTLLAELAQKGYKHFIIDLSECMLMDSTFLGILAQFGIRMNAAAKPGRAGHRTAKCQPTHHGTVGKPRRDTPVHHHERCHAVAG